MKYCIECGTPLNDQQNFCTECGSNQTKVTHRKPEQTSKAATPPPPIVKRDPMKKRTKITIFSAAFITIILFGTYKGLSSYYDPIQDLQAMNQAIVADNESEFTAYIKFDDEALLNQDNYFSYIKENEWDSIRSQYAAIVKKNSNLTSEIDSVNGTPLYTVQPEKRLFGLFTAYSLHAEPYSLTIHTSMDDTEVTIANLSQTIHADNPKEISLYPGTYTIQGSSSSMFGEFAYNGEIDMEPRKESEFNMNFEGDFYSLSTNQPEATLFVNNKDTGLKLGDLEKLGPFPENSNPKMHAQWTTADGSLVKSDTVTKESINFHSNIPFTFNESEMYVQEEKEEEKSEEAKEEQEEVALTKTVKDNAGDTVLHFRDAYEEALNSKDFRMISPFLKGESDAKQGLKEYIEDLKNTEYSYNFTSNNVLDHEKIDNKTVKVTTNEKFIFTNHLKQKINYDKEKIYTLILVEESYKISKIDYIETNRDSQ